MAPKKKENCKKSLSVLTKAEGYSDIGKGDYARILNHNVVDCSCGPYQVLSKRNSRKLRKLKLNQIPNGTVIAMTCASKWIKGINCNNNNRRFIWKKWAEKIKYLAKPRDCLYLFAPIISA